jgi:hypothetical protein
MTDATMSREEIAEFLAAIRKLRDRLDILRLYVAGKLGVITGGRDDKIGEVETRPSHEGEGDCD